MKYHLTEIEMAANFVVEMALQTNSHVIAVQGKMGAGKTTLAKAIFKRLGIHQTNSPTFGLVNTYNIGQDCVYHFDFYRVGKVQELYDIGAHEMLANGFCLVEWPELAVSLLPQNTLWVEIEVVSQTERELSIYSLPDN